MEEIRVWTSGYCHHLNCCGWAYLIQYETAEGVFNISDVDYDKGSTTHQMSLMAILQALEKINDLPDRMTDVVMLFSNDKRVKISVPIIVIHILDPFHPVDDKIGNRRHESFDCCFDKPTCDNSLYQNISGYNT